MQRSKKIAFLLFSLCIVACGKKASSGAAKAGEQPTLPEGASAFEGTFDLVSRLLTQENCDAKGVDATKENPHKVNRLRLGSTRQPEVTKSNPALANTLFTELCDDNGDCDTSPKLSAWTYATFDGDHWLGRGVTYRGVKVTVDDAPMCNSGTEELLLTAPAEGAIHINLRKIGVRLPLTGEACDASESFYETVRGSFECQQVEELDLKRRL